MKGIIIDLHMRDGASVSTLCVSNACGERYHVQSINHGTTTEYAKSQYMVLGKCSGGQHLPKSQPASVDVGDEVEELIVEFFATRISGGR